MRWRPWRIVLFVAFCSTGLAGCANLRLAGDSNAVGAVAADGITTPSAKSDPAPKANLPGAGDVTAAAPIQNNPLESQFALARLCERRAENEQAEQLYKALLEKAPKDARLHHRLGVLSLQKSDFAQAEEHFCTAKSLAPPTAELLSDIGYCYYLQHRLPEAENALNDALRLEPTHAAAINNMALVLGKLGRTQESLDLFRRTNSEAEAYANLAYVLAQNGELAQAEQLYLRALTLDNKMRAAAQAMLQVSDRGQAQAKLASQNLEPRG
jgi:Flp pilus assembly protein TadD